MYCIKLMFAKVCISPTISYMSGRWIIRCWLASSMVRVGSMRNSSGPKITDDGHSIRVLNRNAISIKKRTTVGTTGSISVHGTIGTYISDVEYIICSVIFLNTSLAAETIERKFSTVRLKTPLIATGFPFTLSNMRLPPSKTCLPESLMRKTRNVRRTKGFHFFASNVAGV